MADNKDVFFPHQDETILLTTSFNNRDILPTTDKFLHAKLTSHKQVIFVDSASVVGISAGDVISQAGDCPYL